VVRAVEAWDGNTRIVEITSDVAGGRATVALLLAGPGEPQPTWKLAESIRDRFGGPVDLRVLYQSDVLHEVTAR
jgi:hypothetical protein